MRKKVYIAGPISKGKLADNVNMAVHAFQTLVRLGYAPLCPQLSVYTTKALSAGDDSRCYALGTAVGCGLEHIEWLSVDFAWLDVADAVLRLPGESVGADAEVEYAHRRFIPVYKSIDALIHNEPVKVPA